jgi:hypothetical protein
MMRWSAKSYRWDVVNWIELNHCQNDMNIK